MKIKAVTIDTREAKPQSLKISLVLDPEIAAQLMTLAEHEGVPVVETVRSLIVGSLAAYPSWGIEASDRRRAFDEQRKAIINNLYAWFSEQKWIMEQQIKERDLENQT